MIALLGFVNLDKATRRNVYFSLSSQSVSHELSSHNKLKVEAEKKLKAKSISKRLYWNGKQMDLSMEL